MKALIKHEDDYGLTQPCYWRAALLAVARMAKWEPGTYLHKCRYCDAELPWTDGTDTEYWCQRCGREQPAEGTEVRWVQEPQP